MRKTMLASLVALTGSTSFAANLLVYPEKGQTAQQQSQDKYECYQWAKNQTGFDPESAAGTAGTTPQSPNTGAGRGAARGAAAGAVGGAIAGNAGKGAAIGAGVGGVGGAARRRGQENEIAQQQQQAQAQQQQKMASFNKAQSVCLEGRGYSVG